MQRRRPRARRARQRQRGVWHDGCRGGRWARSHWRRARVLRYGGDGALRRSGWKCSAAQSEPRERSPWRGDRRDRRAAFLVGGACRRGWAARSLGDALRSRGVAPAGIGLWAWALSAGRASSRRHAIGRNGAERGSGADGERRGRRAGNCSRVANGPGRASGAVAVSRE